MAGAIAVTPEQLKSQAKVYQQAASQIQDAIRKVNSMNQQIAQQWKGQAFQAIQSAGRKCQTDGAVIGKHQSTVEQVC